MVMVMVMVMVMRGPVSRCVAVVVAGGAVGACFRQEGSQLAVQGEAPLPQHPFQHRILQQPQLPGLEFQGHMPVAQVVGGLEQGEGVGGGHHQQGFGGGHNLHQGFAFSVAEPFLRLQGLAPGQLQQQIAPADALAQAPQAGALIRGQGQLQGWVAGRVGLPQGRAQSQSLLEHQG